MNRNKTLFFGALIGAVTGLIAANLLNRRAEKSRHRN
jgi:gas vesicle protein